MKLYRTSSKPFDFFDFLFTIRPLARPNVCNGASLSAPPRRRCHFRYISTVLHNFFRCTHFTSYFTYKLMRHQIEKHNNFWMVANKVNKICLGAHRHTHAGRHRQRVGPALDDEPHNIKLCFYLGGKYHRRHKAATVAAASNKLKLMTHVCSSLYSGDASGLPAADAHHWNRNLWEKLHFLSHILFILFYFQATKTMSSFYMSCCCDRI